MSQHRPALINPDTRGALAVALLATAALVGISFTLSYAGLSALAPWAAVPLALAPLIPLFIDGAIGVYTYSALAARARAESAARPWTWVALWTLVSSASNAAHAWSNGPQGWEGLVGATLAGLFPIGSLLGTHEIASRMIGRPAVDAAPSPALAVISLEDARERIAAKIAARPKPAPKAGRRRRVDVDPRDVVRLRDEGRTVRQIAEALPVSKSTVADILKEAEATA